MTGMACRTASCMRGLPGQTHCAGNVSALEEIRSRIGTAASRDAVIGLEQGRISRSWQPSATASRWRPWPNPGFRMYRLVQHEWKGRDALAYLWAMHPAIAGGSVHYVHAVSSRVTTSFPVALPGSAEPCRCFMFCYSDRHAKGPLPAGKGP